MSAIVKEAGAGVPMQETLRNVFTNPKVLYTLLAGAGGGGLLSGYMSSREPQRRNETPQSRRSRILRNALVGGALGAGATGGGALGLEFLGQKRPNDKITQGFKDFFTPKPSMAKGYMAGAGVAGAAVYNSRQRPKWMQQLLAMLGQENPNAEFGPDGKTTAIPIEEPALRSTFGRGDTDAQGEQLRMVRKLTNDQGGDRRKAMGLLHDAGLPLGKHLNQLEPRQPGVMGWVDRARRKLSPASRAGRNLIRGGAAGYLLPTAVGTILNSLGGDD